MNTSASNAGHFHGSASTAMLADTDVNILRAIWFALETQRVPDSQPRQVSPLDMTVEVWIGSKRGTRRFGLLPIRTATDDR